MQPIKRIISGDKVVIYSNEHMQAHLDVLPFIEEAITLIKFSDDKIQKVVVDFGRIVGKTTCVTVTDNDEIYYAIRSGRKWPSKMVKNREPEECSTMCLVIKKTKYENVYRLITAYFGFKSEREEFDTNVTSDLEKERVFSFWKNKALIY